VTGHHSAPADTGQDAAPGIRVRLDELLRDRDMTLTELSERVGVTIVNLSILKTAMPARYASARWPGYARR
jgi:putative transcriptional regulator